MRKLLAWLAVVFLSCLLLPVRAQAGAYTEVFHSGKIDWLKGTAEAVGIAIPARGVAKTGRPKGKAAAEAEKAARRNLLELLGRIKIDSRTSLADLLSQSEQFKAEVQRLVQKTPVQRVRNRKDGGVEATLRIELAGPMAELILPKDIRIIDSVLQPKVPAENTEKAFTGLVVDCSGLRVRPSMAPKIYDEDGQMVYGPPFISREHAVKEGVARYGRDLAASKADGRVGSRPLTVKGIRTAATGSSDVVISNADAARVKASAGNLRSLQRCRVLLVLD
ncbi:MAG: hypothetical protein AB1512_09740 [Thermodesulfobacteriota bacterium]